ncbi:MAG: di-trans,poly-cis-decaprenylcistransferase [Proteobacteria bacterium]|nr:di-trans,poly-cis-decaprenylcistransferase [Pseudomonadota bacterium]
MNNINLPQHLAIIMDGNGRWAARQGQPRGLGHRAGRKALRAVVEHVSNLGIPVLTVFAFSSENWQRPAAEVKLLLELFRRALSREVRELHSNGICISFIGDRSRFSLKLQEKMQEAELLTINNNSLQLNIAVNYGGRWDIAQAAQKLAHKVAAGEIEATQIDEAVFSKALSLSEYPAPDLLIRTGGEQRISNFLLWQLAYSEIIFTDTLWPDFRAENIDSALTEYSRRQRRFGSTPLQAATRAQSV